MSRNVKGDLLPRVLSGQALSNIALRVPEVVSRLNRDEIVGMRLSLGSTGVNVMQQDWSKERASLLRSIAEKEQKLTDFENRFLPKTIEDERLDIKEKNLREKLKDVLCQIDTLKKEIEVLELQKRLKQLEAEHESLISS